MATLLANLLTRREAIGKELASLTATSAGGKPNAPGNVDHVGYKDGLYRELREINEQIVALTAQDGGVDVETYGLV